MARPPRSSRLRGIWIAGAAFIALSSAAAIAGTAAHGIDPAARTSFDQTIAQTKAAMLGDPVGAERLAGSAFALASAWPAGADRELALATAQWLRGEGYYRTNRAGLAEPVIAAALRTAERVAPGSKLNADLLLARARIAVEHVQPQAGLDDLQSAYRMFAKLGDATKRGQGAPEHRLDLSGCAGLRSRHLLL